MLGGGFSVAGRGIDHDDPELGCFIHIYQQLYQSFPNRSLLSQLTNIVNADPSPSHHLELLPSLKDCSGDFGCRADDHSIVAGDCGDEVLRGEAYTLVDLERAAEEGQSIWGELLGDEDLGRASFGRHACRSIGLEEEGRVRGREEEERVNRE